MKLSIIMPAYNEERTLEEAVNSVEKLKIKGKEIIIVNDASKDNTQKIIEKLKKKYKNIRSFTHYSNKGKGGAIRTALENVSGDLIIIQDSDLEYDPNEILKLIEFKKKSGADVVYGSRFLKKNPYSYLSYLLGNIFLNKLTNFLYGTNLTDMETCYKLIPTKIFKEINLKANRFDIEPEITAKISKRGYKIREVGISYKPRSKEEGKKIGWKDGVQAMWTLFKLRF